MAQPDDEEEGRNTLATVKLNTADVRDAIVRGSSKQAALVVLIGPKADIGTHRVLADANEAIFKKILDDTDFRDVLADFYLKKLYDRLRSDPTA